MLMPSHQITGNFSCCRNFSCDVWSRTVERSLRVHGTRLASSPRRRGRNVRRAGSNAASHSGCTNQVRPLVHLLCRLCLVVILKKTILVNGGFTVKERSHVAKFIPSPIFNPLLFSIVSMVTGWITGWMGPSPILPEILFINCDTNLKNASVSL